MQEISVPYRKSLLALIVAIVAITEGCGWTRTMAFRSPTGVASLEIWQPAINHTFGIEIRLVTPKQTVTLLDRHAIREPILQFAYVYWSADESKAALLAAGSPSILKVACDVQTGREVPFRLIEPELVESIRSMYNLPRTVDVIEWANSPDGQAAYAQKAATSRRP